MFFIRHVRFLKHYNLTLQMTYRFLTLPTLFFLLIGFLRPITFKDVIFKLFDLDISSTYDISLPQMRTKNSNNPNYFTKKNIREPRLPKGGEIYLPLSDPVGGSRVKPLI